jgi:hypothetical protein
MLFGQINQNVSQAINHSNSLINVNAVGAIYYA